MKKIVGILAAAAVAVSAFAVDFSAGFQLKADLLNYDGTFNAFKLWNENTKDDKPFIFSVSTDRVGATLKLFDACGDTKYTKGTGAAAAETSAKGKLPSIFSAHAYNIWFKPFDMVRIDLGCQDIATNKEHVTWWKGNITGGKMNNWDGVGDWGYKATVNVDAFELAVALLAADDAWWLSGSNVGETVVYAGYAADFGKINVLFDAKSTFKNLMIAAGYSNTFGDVAIFADAMFRANNGTNGIAVDFDARYSKDGIGLEAYFNWATGLANISLSSMRVACYAKASYALNGGSLFLKFEDDNIIASSFGADITVGYDGNLGPMSYEVAALVSVAGSTIKFSTPCYFRIGF
jgi:hypothetical protein